MRVKWVHVYHMMITQQMSALSAQSHLSNCTIIACSLTLLPLNSPSVGLLSFYLSMHQVYKTQALNSVSTQSVFADLNTISPIHSLGRPQSLGEQETNFSLIL